MPRVAVDGIGTPVDHQIGGAGLAQAAGALPRFLQGDDRRPVATRGRGIDGGAKAIGQLNGRSLAGSAAAGQAIDQRRAGGAENGGRAIEGRVERHGLAADASDGRSVAVELQEPRFGHPAGMFDTSDPIVGDRDFQVVAHAAAERTSHISVFAGIHRFASWPPVAASVPIDWIYRPDHTGSSIARTIPQAADRPSGPRRPSRRGQKPFALTKLDLMLHFF